MDSNIREAKMQDYEILCSVFEEGDEYHRQALPHIFKKPDGSVRTKDFISSIISSKDIKHIELHVWEFNQSAIKFYEKLGYIIACHKMWKMIGG